MRYPLRNACIFILTYTLINGCAGIPPEERETTRNQLNEFSAHTIEKLSSSDSEFKTALTKGVGYFVGSISVTEVLVGAKGVGRGTLHDTKNNTVSYIDIDRVDLGPALGAAEYTAVMVFASETALKKFGDSGWIRAVVAESGVGGTGKRAVIDSLGEDTLLRILRSEGGSLSATARLIRTRVNEDLTDTGLSEVFIPNKNATSETSQGPREWDRALPFLAQKVIDKGYNLPLPYGVGLTYAALDQDQLLTDLKVGFNGSSKSSYPFVSFNNSKSSSSTVSLKLDTWLFPFMNVYAMVGKIDGEAPLNVALDGNGMLDQLEIDCSGLLQNPLCGKLTDQTISFPVKAKFKGNNYGIGTVLAAGWNNWFITLPFNLTYADMDGKKTEGTSITVSPRGGRIFNLGDKGKLAAYLGANYLDTDLTVEGSVSPPNLDLSIDYTIDQENADKWTALLGFNWDVSRRFAVQGEYNGFGGSREAVIASLVFRY